jgi:hypothetical protein
MPQNAVIQFSKVKMPKKINNFCYENASKCFTLVFGSTIFVHVAAMKFLILKMQSQEIVNST